MQSMEQLRAQSARLQETIRQKKRDFDAGLISAKVYDRFIGSAEAETKAMERKIANHRMAAGIANLGVPELSPAGYPVRSVPNNPIRFTGAQIKALYQAASNKMPLTMDLSAPDTPYAAGYGGGGVTEIGLKGFMSGVSTKAGTVTENGLGGGFSGNLPPMQSPYAVGIGYEPTRIAAYLPGVAMPGPSATWLSHTANAAEVNGVPEAGTKGDIGPTIVENQVKPQKIAGLVSTTIEAFQDTENYGEGALASWLPQELTRSLINAESNYILTATTAATNTYTNGPVNSTFNGLLNTSGTLTRAVASGEFPLDTLNKAFIDVRTGPAFAEPDLMVMHPETMGALRRLRDDQGRYIMDLLAGPLGLTADGSREVNPTDTPNAYSIVPQGAHQPHGHLWGVPVVVSTQCPAGTAIVASIKAGGAMWWQRLGLVLMFNQWSDTEWTTNTMGWRVEERVALSVPRPSALNIVTGLPTE